MFFHAFRFHHLIRNTEQIENLRGFLAHNPMLRSVVGRTSVAAPADYKQCRDFVYEAKRGQRVDDVTYAGVLHDNAAQSTGKISCTGYAQSDIFTYRGYISYFRVSHHEVVGFAEG